MVHTFIHTTPYYCIQTDSTLHQSTPYPTTTDTDKPHKPTYSIPDRLSSVPCRYPIEIHSVSDLIKIIKAAGPAEPRNLILRYAYTEYYYRIYQQGQVTDSDCRGRLTISSGMTVDIPTTSALWTWNRTNTRKNIPTTMTPNTPPRRLKTLALAPAKP